MHVGTQDCRLKVAKPTECIQFGVHVQVPNPLVQQTPSVRTILIGALQFIGRGGMWEVPDLST